MDTLMEQKLRAFDESEKIQLANVRNYHREIAVHKDANAARVACCRWKKRWRTNTTEYNTVRLLFRLKVVTGFVDQTVKEREYCERQVANKQKELDALQERFDARVLFNEKKLVQRDETIRKLDIENYRLKQELTALKA